LNQNSRVLNGRSKSTTIEIGFIKDLLVKSYFFWGGEACYFLLDLLLLSKTPSEAFLDQRVVSCEHAPFGGWREAANMMP
jgi:hypothetical protein